MACLHDLAILDRPTARAVELLERFGEPDPVEHFGLEPSAPESVSDATATLLMDLYRRTGSPEVFEALVELARGGLQRRVRARVGYLRSGLDPAEVLQDTLVNVYRYPDRFDGSRPGAFRAWSSTIVDNTIRRQLRRAQSGPDVQLRPVDVLSRERDYRCREPSVAAEQNEACRDTSRALGFLLRCYLVAFQELSERERFVLQMVEVQGMRYAELAGVLGIRPEALKMVVFRARRRIHEKLTLMFAIGNGELPHAAVRDLVSDTEALHFPGCTAREH